MLEVTEEYKKEAFKMLIRLRSDLAFFAFELDIYGMKDVHKLVENARLSMNEAIAEFARATNPTKKWIDEQLKSMGK